jgi:nucleotide-binding universal stress UspA family protein
MFNRILVPLDGSPFAEGALPAAVALAERFDAEIHLFNVRKEVDDELPERRKALDEQAWQYLANTASRLRAITSVSVWSTMRHGNVAHEIVAETGASHDLVVMTSHGRSGLSRFWLGSVADECIRCIERPIFVVHPAEGDPWKAAFGFDRVVVPLDGSQVAESALPMAVLMAELFDVPIAFVRSVVSPIPVESAYFPAPDWMPTEDTVSAARTYLEGIAARVKGRGVRAEVHAVSGRHPATLVDAVAGDGGLVVMAAQCHSPVRRAVLGSVSDKILRTVLSPVLILRAEPARSRRRVEFLRESSSESVPRSQAMIEA